MRSVKKGVWKLIQYDVMDGAVRKQQLFNLSENPHEFLQEHAEPTVSGLLGLAPKANQRNLAEDPAYAEKLKEMETLMLAEMRRLNDPWRLWNQPADGLEIPQKEPSKKDDKKASRKKK
jgi:hypothetical protein